MVKFAKIISILLITVMLVAILGQTVLAAKSASEVIAEIDKADYSSSEISGVKKVAEKVLTAVRNIAIIVAVIMISILGVKYMVGSVEERAGYKKAFVPMIVGAILVVSAASLAKMLFSLSGD